MHTKKAKKAGALATLAIASPFMFFAICGWIATAIADVWSDDWWGWSLLIFFGTLIGLLVVSGLAALWIYLQEEIEDKLKD